MSEHEFQQVLRVRGSMAQDSSRSGLKSHWSRREGARRPQWAGAGASLDPAERRCRLLVRNAPLGIFTVNQFSKIAEANPALSGMLELADCAVLVGSDVRDHRILVESGIASRVAECMREGSGRVYSGEFEGEDGERRVLKCHLARMENGSGASEVLVLVDDVTVERRDRARWERLALYDEVTGLINQNNFCNTLREQVERARTEGKRLTVAQLDIDYFKSINDSYGHAAGTRLLAAIGGRIRASIKKSRDLGIRNGGDELLVVYMDYDEGDPENFVRRLVRELTKPYFFSEPGKGILRIQCTFSVGVAELLGQSAEDLYRDADRATYRAKQNGRNRIEFHRP